MMLMMLSSVFKSDLSSIMNYKSFSMNQSFHERKSLIAVLMSENENRSSFNEKVIEVHDVQCRLSLLLKSKKKNKNIR